MFLNEDKSRLPIFFYLFYCLNWLEFDAILVLFTFDFLFDMKNFVLYDLALFFTAELEATRTILPDSD